MFGAERFAGGAHGIDLIAFAGAGPGWTLGPGDLDDALAVGGQVDREARAVAAGALDHQQRRPGACTAAKFSSAA